MYHKSLEDQNFIIFVKSFLHCDVSIINLEQYLQLLLQSIAKVWTSNQLYMKGESEMVDSQNLTGKVINEKSLGPHLLMHLQQIYRIILMEFWG